MSLQPNVKKSFVRQQIVDASLLHYANENRSEGFFNDITIKAGRDTFPANRMVLSCYCRFFETMFKSNMREQYEQMAEIQSIDGKTMKTLIDFIYTGNVVIDKENVMHLLSSADYLLLDNLKLFCLEFLESNITSENCFDVLEAAKLYENSLVKMRAQQFIEDQFADVAQGLGFKNLTKDEVVLFISTLNRFKVKEAALYKAIMAWIKYSEEERKRDFSELFQLVNLNHLSSRFLAEVVAEEEIVKENVQCLKLVMSGLSKHLKNKPPRECGSKLLALGGKRSPSKVTEVFNAFSEEESNFPDLPAQLLCHSSLNFRDTVYCIGGETVDLRAVVSNKVWELKLHQHPLKWENVASLKVGRQVMGSTIFNDTLVVAGGHDGTSTLSSTEIYVKPLDEWQTIAALQEPRFGNALVECKGRLYAVGGWGIGHALSSVEQLSSLKGKWNFVKPMQTSRKWLAAVSHNAVIYAIGGAAGDDGRCVKTVEKYDPDLNKWVFVSDMKKERDSHTACILQGKIFVVGGLNAKRKVVKEIECYDPSCDEWSVVGKTHDELFHHSMVVV